MTPFQVPLQPFNQKFTISLGGIVYACRCVWNAFNNSWMLDINDQNGNAICTSVPLITGCNLLAQVMYLLIGGQGGQLTCQSSFNPDAVPTYDNLGTVGNLFFVTP